MVTSLESLIFDVKGVLRGGTLSALMDDDYLIDDHIKFKIHNIRAFLIRQDLNKGNSISDNILQTLCCIDMSLVNSSECPEFPSTCKIYRSTEKIPSFMESDFADNVLAVRNMDILQEHFDIMSMIRAINRVSYKGRVKAKRGIAFFKERYLYIVDYDKMLKKVCIDAVFDNPEEVMDYHSEEAECSPADKRYPISQWMIKPLTDLVVEYFKRGIQGSDVKEDNSLNLKPNNEPN